MNGMFNVEKRVNVIPDMLVGKGPAAEDVINTTSPTEAWNFLNAK